MKKCLLVLGLVMFAGSSVFARCCDCYSRCDCNRGYYNPPPPPPPPMMHGYSPAARHTAVSAAINVGSGHIPYPPGPFGRSGRARGGFGASIYVGI